MADSGHPNQLLPREATLQQRYEDLRGKVLVYAGNNASAAALAQRADGVVLHGEAGFDAARTMPSCLLAVDSELYAQDRTNDSGQTEMFPERAEESIGRQVSANADFLITPSRFPRAKGAEARAASMRGVLEHGREYLETVEELGLELPTFVPLVVRYDELADHRWTDLVAESQVPLAPVFASPRDPLETAEQISGAVELIRASPSAFVPRCDASLAGLLVVGSGLFGAIGSTSTVRHLWIGYPSRGPKVREESGFIPCLRCWAKRSKLVAARAEPDPGIADLFACDCSVCGPGGDVRDLVAPGVPPERLLEHSVASSIRVTKEVLESKSPVGAWRSACTEAQAGYRFLRDHGLDALSEPPFLQAWLDYLG